MPSWLLLIFHCRCHWCRRCLITPFIAELIAAADIFILLYFSLHLVISTLIDYLTIYHIIFSLHLSFHYHWFDALLMITLIIAIICPLFDADAMPCHYYAIAPPLYWWCHTLMPCLWALLMAYAAPLMMITMPCRVADDDAYAALIIAAVFATFIAFIFFIIVIFFLRFLFHCHDAIFFFSAFFWLIFSLMPIDAMRLPIRATGAAIYFSSLLIARCCRWWGAIIYWYWLRFFLFLHCFRLYFLSSDAAFRFRWLLYFRRLIFSCHIDYFRCAFHSWHYYYFIYYAIFRYIYSHYWLFIAAELRHYLLMPPLALPLPLGAYYLRHLRLDAFHCILLILMMFTPGCHYIIDVTPLLSFIFADYWCHYYWYWLLFIY